MLLHIDQFFLSSDHPFDLEVRKHLKGKLKEATVSTNRTAIEKGTLGVWWEMARLNQSKLLPTIRMGLN